jgi:adenine/guanine phosphoribosyltransferase-like PRPP-binding protein
MQADSILPGQSVVVIDDLIATGMCSHQRCQYMTR